MKAQIEQIKTKEEFFSVFNGLCKIAEAAFNDFDNQDIATLSSQNIAKELSYLMSAVFVIAGMRGEYHGFVREDFSPFFVVVDGQEYDQNYLYKMSDYFVGRFDGALNKVKDISPDNYETYKKVWGNY